MISIKIDNKEYQVPEGITVIQACEIAKIEIPRFCYHEKLKIAGNCRMCLVEMRNVPKPVASCATNVFPNMEIFTDTNMVKEARSGVSEFLLINHPLDCPICDQAGECDLQDQTLIHGKDYSRFSEEKRAVEQKDFGPLVQTQMNRCIHCTRCIRFVEDIAGTAEIGAFSRGENMEVSTYLSKTLETELSGNIIDLCPVGALTSKPYSSTARSWELTKTNSIDVMDAIGSNIRVDSKGFEVMRVLPRNNEEINEEWISDKTRFSYDGLKYQRLDKFYSKQSGKLQEVSFDVAAKEVARCFKNFDKSQIAALSGDLSSVEEVFALKSFLDKAGVDQIDCRSYNSKINPKDQASYVFNSKISGLDQADLFLFVGVNPRKESPIINARIRRAVVERKAPAFCVGFDGDLTYEYQNLGDDVATLSNILNEKSEILSALKSSKKPMIIFGKGVFENKNGKEITNLLKKIAEKFDFIQKDWNGFNMLHHNASLTGSLDIGFYSDNINYKEIIEKFNEGEIKILYLLGEDGLGLKKQLVRSKKNYDGIIIYQGTHGNVGAEIADIILPSLAYTEQSATYVNIEGKIQQTTKAVPKIEGSYSALEIFLEIAVNMKIDLGLVSNSELFSKIQEIHPQFNNFEEIKNRSWEKAVEVILEGDVKIKAPDFNFYHTNVISKSSKIMRNFIRSKNS
jgi:NADH-quinone oxidoreductase subunit G